MCRRCSGGSLLLGKSPEVLVQLLGSEFAAWCDDAQVALGLGSVRLIDVRLVAALELANLLLAELLGELMVLKAGEDQAHLVEAGHLRATVRLATDAVL